MGYEGGDVFFKFGLRRGRRRGVDPKGEGSEGGSCEDLYSIRHQSNLIFRQGRRIRDRRGGGPGIIERWAVREAGFFNFGMR